jgi:TolA-binding protein
MVKQKEYKLQETVTVAGVRGAEAEDQVLDKLYYKGAKRYPSQDKLKKAIDVLRKSIAKNPKSADAPKQKFYVAQCYEKLGEEKNALDYYTQVTKSHGKSPWAEKANKALKEMAGAKK